VDIGAKIDAGAKAFLKREYTFMIIFLAVFSVIVYGLVDIYGQTRGDIVYYRFYSTIAYILGAVTSMICGYIGMQIAVAANFRTTFKAITSLEGAFNTAY